MKLASQVCKALFLGKSVNKISLLGNGKMGRVYKIELDTGEILCVKILSKNHYTTASDSCGWKLAYEHLGFDFKSYKDDQYFYFTIPYFEGEQFHYAIQYNIRSRLEIIRNLIKAVHEIHDKGIIHRDIKCNNIIINKKAGNKVNIIDFGRSIKVFDSSTGKASAYIPDLQLPGQGTLLSNIKRTFQPYTPPEYFIKNPKCNYSNIGYRSDFYSIAQLFRFLIPEYSHLADKVLNTNGPERNTAFTEFTLEINKLLNDKLNEPDKEYFDIYIFYRKVIFFICEVLNRLITLLQSPWYSNLGLFKTKQNLSADLAASQMSPTLCK